MHSLPARRPGFHRITIAASVVVALIAVVPLIAKHGMPLFLHDWEWSPFPGAVRYTGVNLLSAWSTASLGSPNSIVSANPLSWLKVVSGFLPSGKAGELLYLGLSIAFLNAGTVRLLERTLKIAPPLSLLGAASFSLCPVVFSKIASGQSSYWAALAAFIWGLSYFLDGFRERSLRDALIGAVLFGAATIQMQFTVFGAIALGVMLLCFPSLPGLLFAVIGCFGIVSLALPSIWLLAAHGPMIGASVSEPYGYWNASHSLSLHDAIALLGYGPQYVKRALDNLVLLSLTYYAAWAFAALGVAGLLLRRSRTAAFFAAIGVIAFVWVTGVNGPAAQGWKFLFTSVPDAFFLRELYHAAFLLALAEVVLACLLLNGWSRRISIPIAIALFACTALPFLTGGFSRVLTFAPVSPDYSRAISDLKDRHGRVLFWPAARPLATAEGQVGGTDGLDWISPTERSLYTYFLQAPVAYDVQRLSEGRIEEALTELRRLECNAIVIRKNVLSLAPRAMSSAELDQRLLNAGVPRILQSPTLDVFDLGQTPLTEIASAANALPASADDFAPNTSIVYLDEPGPSASAVANFDRAFKPDPKNGWVDQRDAPWAINGGLNGFIYGLESQRPQNVISFPGKGTVQVAVARGRKDSDVVGPFERLTLPRGKQLHLPGPIVVAGTSDRPIASGAGSGAIDAVQSDPSRPWQYAADAHISHTAVIVLRQTYDPLWQLRGDSIRVLRHFRIDGAFNGWLVAGSGPVHLTFWYSEQRIALSLLIASVVCWLGLLASAVIVPVRYRRFVRRPVC